MVAPPYIESVVVGLRRITETVREFLLSPAEGRMLPPYDPGAHIEVVLATRDHPRLVRHYSLLGGTELWDDGPHIYRIAVQREETGQGGSRFLHDEIGRGARVTISPPKNDFPLALDAPRSLIIAGGIGITPIYSMVRALVRREASFQLYFCARHSSLLAYASDIKRMAGARVRFHLDGGDRSRSLDIGALIAAEPQSTHVYVCGPSGLNNAAIAAARAHGLPEYQIHTESFAAAAPSVDASLEVELRRSGEIVNVPANMSILDALLVAGHDALYECHRGECGMCSLPVLDADGPIDHRDTYLTAEQKASGKIMCICVSRIKGGRLVLDA